MWGIMLHNHLYNELVIIKWLHNTVQVGLHNTPLVSKHFHQYFILKRDLHLFPLFILYNIGRLSLG